MARQLINSLQVFRGLPVFFGGGVAGGEVFLEELAKIFVEEIIKIFNAKTKLKDKFHVPGSV